LFEQVVGVYNEKKDRQLGERAHRPLLAEKRKYTYHDNQTWPMNERWEIINGIPMICRPPPNLRHQIHRSPVYRYFFSKCAQRETSIPWISPTDVVLSDY
jgi:hypothetical protein